PDSPAASQCAGRRLAGSIPEFEPPPTGFPCARPPEMSGTNPNPARRYPCLYVYQIYMNTQFYSPSRSASMAHRFSNGEQHARLDTNSLGYRHYWKLWKRGYRRAAAPWL